MATMEQVFLHDLLNTAAGLRGLVEYIRRTDLIAEPEQATLLSDMTESLVDEIQHHRKLRAAERGELVTESVSVAVKPLLEGLHRLCSSWARTRVIELLSAPDVVIQSDPVLLRRVLLNLLKNAIESTPPGAAVRLSCEVGQREIVFRVNNPGRIDPSIETSLFQEFTTTKSGVSRGLGLYSVKLFGEGYLKGRIEWTSGAAGGVTFSFRIPCIPAASG